MIKLKKLISEQKLMVADKEVLNFRDIKDLIRNGYQTLAGRPPLKSFAIKGHIFISFDAVGQTQQAALMAATQNRKAFEQREGSRLKFMIPTIKQSGNQFEAKELVKIDI
jgi:hypothetical protein